MKTSTPGTHSLALAAALVAAALGLSGLAWAADSKPLAIGAKAPLAETKLKSATNGQEVSIAKQAGPAGTLVVFTCDGCPYAQAWEERIVALGNTFAKKGIGVLLINSNSPAV